MISGRDLQRSVATEAQLSLKSWLTNKISSGKLVPKMAYPQPWNLLFVFVEF